MLVGVVSKLNSTAYSVFRGLAIQQQGRVALARQGNLLTGNSVHSYSTRLQSTTNQFSLGRFHSRKPMTLSGSNATIGDVYNDELLVNRGSSVCLAKRCGVFFNDRSYSNCQKATLRLRTPVQSSCNFRLFSGPRSNNYHSLSTVCYSTGAAHDVSFDGNPRDEQIGTSSILSDQTLKLSSGSCYLPHPAKEATGGEDAHFICEDEQTIGVADGVGGWADVGVNAGLFSRELMSHSVAAIQKEPKGSIDPARVLEKAHSATKAKGSSTAVIITLTDKGLHAINLGDSGFMVIRDGHTIFQSPVQQHGFNFTYQLESGAGADLPSSGQVFTIPVVKGDVVVAGTDGLFDNLYNNEVTAVVVHAIRAGIEPHVTAQKIAALARERALNKTRQTPFSTAAQEAGFRYYGGKLDDITVVVSYVTNPINV